MKRSLRHAPMALSMALMALLPACIEELPSGILLERPRVLGARVQVEADDRRAQPNPGEGVTLRWLVAPDDAQWTSAMSACELAPSNNGFPGCAGEPFAAGLSEPSTSPEFAFVMPPTARAALVLGVLCEGGTPDLEAELPGCTGEGATTERVTYTVSAATPGAPANQHPRIVDASFELDGAAWAAPPEGVADGACAALEPSAGLPRVTLRGEEEPSELTISIDPAEREEYLGIVLGNPPTTTEAQEELELTHITTAGRFPRLTTEIFDEESSLVRIDWRHPAAEDVPAEGEVVRFIFVLRDDRGGMERADRALCIAP